MQKKDIFDSNLESENTEEELYKSLKKSSPFEYECLYLGERVFYQLTFELLEKSYEEEKTSIRIPKHFILITAQPFINKNNFIDKEAYIYSLKKSLTYSKYKEMFNYIDFQDSCHKYINISDYNLIDVYDDIIKSVNENKSRIKINKFHLIFYYFTSEFSEINNLIMLVLDNEKEYKILEFYNNSYEKPFKIQNDFVINQITDITLQNLYEYKLRESKLRAKTYNNNKELSILSNLKNGNENEKNNEQKTINTTPSNKIFSDKENKTDNIQNVKQNEKNSLKNNRTSLNHINNYDDSNKKSKSNNISKNISRKNKKSNEKNQNKSNKKNANNSVRESKKEKSKNRKKEKNNEGNKENKEKKKRMRRNKSNFTNNKNEGMESTFDDKKEENNDNKKDIKIKKEEVNENEKNFGIKKEIKNFNINGELIRNNNIIINSNNSNNNHNKYGNLLGRKIQIKRDIFSIEKNNQIINNNSKNTKNYIKRNSNTLNNIPIITISEYEDEEEEKNPPKIKNKNSRKRKNFGNKSLAKVKNKQKISIKKNNNDFFNNYSKPNTSIKAIDSNLIKTEKPNNAIFSKIYPVNNISKNSSINNLLLKYMSEEGNIIGNVTEIQLLKEKIDKNDNLYFNLIYTSIRDKDDYFIFKNAVIDKYRNLILVKTKKNKRFALYFHDKLFSSEDALNLEIVDMKGFIFSFEKFQFYEPRERLICFTQSPPIPYLFKLSDYSIYIKNNFKSSKHHLGQINKVFNIKNLYNELNDGEKEYDIDFLEVFNVISK